MWPFFHCKKTSSLDAAELPLHEDKDKNEGKEEEKKEEETVEHKETDGSMKHKDAEVKGTSDWRKDQEEESRDWPRERVCHTHERAIPIQETVETLDITEEGKWKHTKACTCIDQNRNIYVNRYVGGGTGRQYGSSQYIQNKV